MQVMSGDYTTPLIVCIKYAITASTAVYAINVIKELVLLYNSQKTNIPNKLSTIYVEKIVVGVAADTDAIEDTDGGDCGNSDKDADSDYTAAMITAANTADIIVDTDSTLGDSTLGDMVLINHPTPDTEDTANDVSRGATPDNEDVSNDATPIKPSNTGLLGFVENYIPK